MFNLPIVGGMATMPSRENSLIEALPNILKNVDILYLYLDKYEYVPKFLYKFPKIKIIENLNIGVTGKFLGVQMHHKSCIFLDLMMTLFILIIMSSILLALYQKKTLKQ